MILRTDNSEEIDSVETPQFWQIHIYTSRQGKINSATVIASQC